jgi:hypothetical protein
MHPLGGTRDNRFTAEAHRSGFEARQARADQKAAELAPAIAELRAAGVTSLRGIARALNERGIQPPSRSRLAGDAGAAVVGAVASVARRAPMQAETLLVMVVVVGCLDDRFHESNHIGRHHGFLVNPCVAATSLPFSLLGIRFEPSKRPTSAHRS